MQSQIQKKWIVADSIPVEVANEFNGYSNILGQLLFNRNVINQTQAEKYLQIEGSLHDPFLMKDMDKAVDIIHHAIINRHQIVVYGDYDVDGVAATAVVFEAVKRLGGEVRAYIPNRFDEGYGLNKTAILALRETGCQLLITVDCGIRSHEEVKCAIEMGIEVIISDHHEPGNTLPQNCPILCPKQPEDGYPFSHLAGVGIAYKFIEAYLTKYPSSIVQVEDWLDLVALGMIADVVPLISENRSLTKAGLRQLRLGTRPGLVSLANISGLDLRKATAQDIGFILAPRLNAAGRLESAMNALLLLISTDIQEAAKQAQLLDNQNLSRQAMTREMLMTAELITPYKVDNFLYFVADDSFNLGVIGLVASRVVESYYRPAVICSSGDRYSRGSCRSIPEFHITRALDECSDLLERHGGHAMAAGFTIKNEKLSELENRLQKIAKKTLSGKPLQPQLIADMEISFHDLHPRVLLDIDKIEPCGQENPGVHFVTRSVKVIKAKVVGNENQHIKLTLSNRGMIFDAIAFRQGFWHEHLPPLIDILFSFERNLFNGKEYLQLNIHDIRESQNIS